MLTHVLDWTAAVLTLVGMNLVARKKWQGWAVHSANAFLWGYLMWRVRLWGLLTLEVFLLAQAVWALHQWRKNSP